MNYEVRIAGRAFEVAVDGDRVRVNGREVQATLHGLPTAPLSRLVVDGQAQVVALSRREGGWAVYGHGHTWTVEVEDERQRALRRLVGGGGARPGGGAVRAPMPGLVLRLEVAVGQRVEAGAGLVVLEAMKMENEIRAPGAGLITRIGVVPGQAVEKGAVLVEIGEAQG